jgi:hypothetical protein
MDSPTGIGGKVVERKGSKEIMKRWLEQDLGEEPFPAQAAAEIDLKWLKDR